MENKKDLAKIAVAALILASATPVNGHADHIEAHGIFLAADCAAHGCPATKNSNANNIISDNALDQPNATSGNSYNTYSPYSKGASSKSGEKINAQEMYNGAESPSTDYRKPANGESNYSSNDNNNPKNASSTERTYYGNHFDFVSDAYTPGDRYTPQQTGTTSQKDIEGYRGATYESTPHLAPEYDSLSNSNQGYHATTDDNLNRAAVTTLNSSATLTEAQLLGMLTSQGRAIYLNLNPEGKALAIQLASQDSYRDKNLAVKEAQRRMNERRGLPNR
jgi:hypothetical protein